MPLIAYAYKSGEIGFCNPDDIPPRRTIAFTDNVFDFPALDDRTFKMQVCASAQLASDGETFLVPGLPDARPGEDIAQIFLDWVDRVFPGAQLTAY
ncbi:hypothetical protein [Oricola sp.]|uniref:hypothetical protein n=1 Tax=Oricola sp. TaxID=1979950 RepID=UPI0025E569EB|nr:hypothetical protein [Oricola sp.]MCI5075674.1 hypothetical protein [Oricola sp.]